MLDETPVQHYVQAMSARTVIALLAPIALIGCTSSNRQATDLRVRTELVNLGERVEQITERLDTIENQNDRLTKQIEILERAMRDARDVSISDARKLTTQLTTLKKEIVAVDMARREDRKIIVDEITARVAEMMKQLAPAAASIRSQSGYEHTVQPRQTLSEIAAHYKVTTDRIVEANKLANPNSIRVGQKLFIPD